MGRKPGQTVQAVEGGETNPVKAAETVIATLAGISPDGPGPKISLEGACNLLNGATSTAATIRIRRGTVAGSIVGAAFTSQIAVEKQIGLSINALDQPEGELAGQTYVLTIECPGATTNPKVTGATLTATF